MVAYSNCSTSMYVAQLHNIVHLSIQCNSCTHSQQLSCCTLTCLQTAKCGSSYEALQDLEIPDYHCNDRHYCKFHFYDLTFAHYSRIPAAAAPCNGFHHTT